MVSNYNRADFFTSQIEKAVYDALSGSDVDEYEELEDDFLFIANEG